MLDALGATHTRIVVSGDLDEYVIAALESDDGGRAPIDAYGVGTQVVTGSGFPTAGFVYKLVAIADRPGADASLRPVAKQSVGKETHGSPKTPFRVRDPGGHTIAEVLTIGDTRVPEARQLHCPLVVHGDPCATSLEAARAHHVQARAELPPEALDLSAGAPALHARMPERSSR